MINKKRSSTKIAERVDGLKNETRANSHSRDFEILGCLLLCASVWMFGIGHRHHTQLSGSTKYNTFNHREHHRYTRVDDKIYDGEFISDILQGTKPLPNNQSYLQIRFRPGTLALSSAQTLQHCHVDMNIFKEHFDKLYSVQVSVSDVNKLIYRNIPKSASSSSRRIMQDFFDGHDKMVRHYQLSEYVLEKNYTLVSFIRDPLDRFYSSYDEAFLRMGPWWGTGNLAEEKPAIHKAYTSNKHKVDPYPYLYEGMTTLNDFRKMYCPSEILEQPKGYLKCINVETIDDGQLTSRFEQFVRDYDGMKPIDNHLRLQVAFLVYNSKSYGAPLPISALYNSSEAHEGWDEIASTRGLFIAKDEMTRGRKNARRFNLSLVTNATKQKICQIFALDYCCLNLVLPDICRSDDHNSSTVYCTVERKSVKDESGTPLSKLVIQSYRSDS